MLFRTRPSAVSALSTASTVLVFGLLLLALVGCGNTDENAEENPDSTPSSSASTEQTTEDEGAEPPAAETTSTTSSPALIDTDLTDVIWVVHRDDGIYDDRGRRLTDLVPPGLEPTLSRSDDGDLLISAAAGGYRWTVGQTAPEVDGQIEPNEGESNNQITAANDVTVVIIDAETTLDSTGSVEQVLQPAQLQVRYNGEVQWTTDVGGIAAHVAQLVDFDGRYVLLARGPVEPANPAIQHIVYDLACPTGEGCTQTFMTFAGMASLVGPDSDEAALNPQLLDLCPTAGERFITSADVPTPFDRAYQRAGAILRSCDAYALRMNEDDLDRGWIWTEAARALQGPHRRVDDDTYRWGAAPDRVAVQTANIGTYVAISFEIPRQQAPGTVTVTMSPTMVLVSGRAGPDTVEVAREAASALADSSTRQLTDWLEVDGPDRDQATLDQFATAVDQTLSDQATGEVQLTGRTVQAWASDTTDPGDDDDALAFAFADFAAGGESSFADLPLADEVALGLGSRIYSIESGPDLANRQLWSVNAAVFEDFEGPFNLLDLAPAPSRFTIGAHDRCASSIPRPAPAELARHRRIAILPAEDSIDSCLAWTAIELFVDEGQIVGVVGDAFGP